MIQFLQQNLYKKLFILTETNTKEQQLMALSVFPFFKSAISTSAEKKRELNVAMEFDLFNRRITVSIEITLTPLHIFYIINLNNHLQERLFTDQYRETGKSRHRPKHRRHPNAQRRSTQLNI